MSNDVTITVTQANPVTVVSTTSNPVTIQPVSVLPLKDIHKSEQFTATGGQTKFTLANTFRADSCRVFKNGVLVQRGAGTDYQETDSLSSITFNTGLDAGDRVEFDYVIV